jgi:hypothetical protein
MEKNPEDNAMRRTHLAVALVGAAFAFCGFVFFGKAAAMSIFVGATLASVNLKVLSNTVSRLVQGSSAPWVGVALLKFIVLMAIVYALIEFQWVQSLGLALGFLALPVGILLGAGLSTSSDSEGNYDSSVGSDHA